MGAYGGTVEASKTNVCIDGIDSIGKMPADINRDCDVNMADFIWLASEWLDTTKE
jgi:hypothetical protein